MPDRNRTRVQAWRTAVARRLLGDVEVEHEAEELEAIAGPAAVEEKVKPLIAIIFKASHRIAQEGEAAAAGQVGLAYKEKAAALGLPAC